MGSNSVRLVLYRLEGRAIWTVYNEKVLAGLGRDLAATGRLSPEGVEIALTALRRFASVLDGVRPAAVLTAATAAVREAADGEEFSPARGRRDRPSGARPDRRGGGPLRGPGRAGRRAGRRRGRRATWAAPAWSCAGSAGGKVEGGVTLPLGPFSLATPDGFDADHARAMIAERLKPMARDYSGAVLHAVGGAWRNLALIHMSMADYPLRIVHQYAMTGPAGP